jgi:hypothetical protein
MKNILPVRKKSRKKFNYIIFIGFTPFIHFQFQPNPFVKTITTRLVICIYISQWTKSEVTIIPNIRYCRVGENFFFLFDIGSDRNWSSVLPMGFVSVPPFFCNIDPLLYISSFNQTHLWRRSRHDWLFVYILANEMTSFIQPLTYSTRSSKQQNSRHTGTGVLSYPWALCLSHHFFCNIVYNLSNFVFSIQNWMQDYL